MASVRGTVVLHAVRFVREGYGDAGHDAVIRALPASVCGTFLGPLHDGSWKPVDDLVAYMETARRLHAPQDGTFFRRLGRHSGALSRAAAGFRPMVATPETAIRMGPVTWRAFYDEGRLEVVESSERRGVVRVHGFPASRPLCERRSGAWETLLSTDALSAVVEETRCAAAGAPCCETEIVWMAG